MSILHWNIFLKIQSQCNYTTILPFLLPFVAGKKAMHPSGRYFSVAKTGKSGGCCLLALQDSMWIVMQTVWGSSQSASPGKPYHGAEGSDHQDNTSQKAKSGLVKNWHTSCLVDMSHLQPRFSAPSTRLRAHERGMKSLGNKENIFWEAPGLYVPRGMCKLKGYPLPTWWEGNQCSRGKSRGDALPLRKGLSALAMEHKQAEVWQSQPLHFPFCLLLLFPSGPSALLSFNSKIHLPL